MVNALTWRDVTAPDFRGTMAGFQVADTAINSATKSISDSLAAFDAGRKNDAASALFLAASKYQDPAAFKAALADGSLFTKSGVDPSLLTVDAIKGVENRASSLLSQATSQVALDHSKVMNPLLETSQAQQNTFDAANNPLRLENQRLINSGQLQTQSQSATRFGNEQFDRNQEIAARTAAEEVARRSTTYSDGMSALANDSSLDPVTRAKALELLPSLVRQYNPGAGDVPAGSGGSKAAAAIAGAATGSPGLSTAGALDEYFRNAKGQESGGKIDAKNPLSSASGLYQFTDDTWKSMMTNHPELGLTMDGRFDAAQQEKAMKAFTLDNAKRLDGAGIPITPGNLYMAHFLGAGGATQFISELAKNPNADASTLFPKEAKANPTIFNGRTLAEVYALQTKRFGGESSVPVTIADQNKALNTQAATLISNIASRNSQNDAAGIQGQYAKTQADTEFSMQDAITKLKKGSFKDVPDDLLRGKINEIITQSKRQGRIPVTYATAAAILDNTSSPEAASIGGAFNPLNWGRLGVTSNQQAQTDELAKIGQGFSEADKNENAAHSAIADAVKTAVSTKDKAYAELVQAQEAARLRPDVRMTIPDKLSAYNRAAGEVDKLIKQAAGNKKLAPLFRTP